MDTDRAFCPRLSTAKDALPLIWRNLIAAVSRNRRSFNFDAIPIVEGGLLGFELVPDRPAHSYLILGCNAKGEPVLRKTSYGLEAPGALNLIARDGRVLPHGERVARSAVQPRDYLFGDWPMASQTALDTLSSLCPELGRRTHTLRESQPGFEDALAVAYALLVRWDPFIYFVGLPHEACMGFELAGASGERGRLSSPKPNHWTLEWSASDEGIHKTWSWIVGESHAGRDDADVIPDCPDRRSLFRRATDRATFGHLWTGRERRQWRGRRATDQHDH